VYSPYYKLHDERVARIKECCVDNAVGLDGRHQPEVQSKVDVLGGPPVTAATVQAEHRLILRDRSGKWLR